ncbi:disulfide bond formation protein DsbB [Ferrimonas sediminicola]|uniref:Disulfide bond formation protein B n=1 Tax=Ferrimonas sediminicola TaxID=2569538 RepID=A0A4U1BI62_9GAMM|nr:disulfide bond formation protein DsbB [Ferrimonas sediminicola]TKB50229.1 disulfide bond formation protein DsbB [Ferrimonas sediminicola]
MLNQARQFTCERRSWLLLAASALLLELIALVFQYGMDLKPCVYCIYVRLAVFSLLAVALITAIRPGYKPLRTFGFLGWAGASAWALSLNLSLHAKQTAPPTLFGSTCDAIPNFPAWAPLHEWLPSVFMPTGDCSDSPWSFLGLSMAQWLIGLFVAHLLLCLLFWLTTLTEKRSGGECCGGSCH